MTALSFATAQLLRVLPRERVSRLAGQLADHRWSASLGRTVVRLYCKAYDVALDECIESEWDSFDSFFTRTLRDGARPIDASSDVIVSPSDGLIDSMGTIEPGSKFIVKGRPYKVSELVGSEDEAKRYEGGLGCVVYLSPRDYHRVHSPCAGVIGSIRSMPGDYFPVNEVGVRHVPNLFARNRRVAIPIETEELGRVTVVMVAAMIVGRITVTGVPARDVPYGIVVPETETKVERGDEIGMFHLGSTAVVFVEKKAAGKFVVPDGPVRMGQAIVKLLAGEKGPNGAPKNGKGRTTDG